MKAKGITYIELIAAMAMTSVLMLAIYFIYASGINNYIDGQRKEKAVNSVKLVMTTLSMELKNSSKYVVNPKNYIVNKPLEAIPQITFKQFGDASIVAKDYIPIVYIEGNSFSSYMYVLRNVGVGTKKVNGISKDVYELHKLSFANQARKQYEPMEASAHAVTYTDYEVDSLYTTGDPLNTISDSHLYNFIKNLTGYDTSSYILNFDPWSQNCYLFAKKASDPLYYRIKMKELKSLSLDVLDDKKVSGNIESISLLDQGYECKIYIKSVETNHEETIDTSTSILNYRGAS